MEFCKAFNAQTQAQAGLIIPVVITVYADRSFTFITKTPPASVLLKRAAGWRRGRRSRARRRSGKVTRQQVEEIARLKMPDLTAADRRGGDAHRRGHGAQPRARGGLGDAWRRRASDIGRRRRRSIATRRYPMDEAIRTLLDAGGEAKFDESVELAVRLGVDPRQADQNVRGTVVLPHGTGKTVRVLVFAKGDKAQGGAGSRRRPRRRRGHRQEDPGRAVARVRHGHRHARHDGAGRPAREGARAAWPDAEPEGRHGHLRRRQGGARGEGRQGRVPRRQGRHRPRRRSASAASAPRSCSRTRRRW